MRTVRHLPVALAALAAVMLAAPAGVLAAEPVTLTGVVMQDGTPVAGVEVVVTIRGADVILAATTDDHGAFAVDAELDAGAEVELFATGRTSRSDPDEEGCVTSETPVGRLVATVEVLPPAAFTVLLDTVLTSEVCTATGRPAITPPATDRPAGGTGWPAAPGLLVVLGLLALAGGGWLGLAGSRKRARLRG